MLLTTYANYTNEEVINALSVEPKLTQIERELLERLSKATQYAMPEDRYVPPMQSMFDFMRPAP